MKSLLSFCALLLALNSHAYGQTLELGYGFVSIEAGWGKLPATQKMDASLLFDSAHSRSFHYKPGLRYTFVNSTSTNATDEFGDHVDGQFHMFFLLPASFDVTFSRFAFLNRMGFGWSDASFPNENGLKTNFVLEAGFRYAVIENLSLSLRYSHISNGYRGPTNPGVDNLIFSTEIGL